MVERKPEDSRALSKLTFTPTMERSDPGPESISSLACLQYSWSEPSWPERVQQAHRILDQDTSGAKRSVDEMAVVGDSLGLVNAIADRPRLVNESCGILGWPPLLYAVYSRIRPPHPARSMVETVSVLLNAGADANAGFLWRGLVPPFTALTGALGGGERCESRHEDGLSIARMLLEAGADPNDGQAVYNNGRGSGDPVDRQTLDLLIESGLGQDRQGPWYERFGPRLHSPAELLVEARRVLKKSETR